MAVVDSTVFSWSGLPETDERTNLYLRYLIERGAVERWGFGWESAGRIEKILHEMAVIERMGFSAYFILLARIMQFCRDEGITYGPGRGSVGGSLVAYIVGIHEVDPMEFGLMFERFLNEERVSYPDVDIDFSQRDRHKVIEFIRSEFGKNGNVVVQVGAFARMSGRGVIDNMLNARSQTDPSAGAIAENLRKCLPEANITGGTKQQRELAFWLDTSSQGKPDEFRELAEQADWLETLLKLDGLFTHTARHAAGVVILSADDLRRLPLYYNKNQDTGQYEPLTGFDMYALDQLAYLKLDILGLRTLDVVSDAHRAIGGSGQTRDLVQLWREHKDDPEPYELLCEADTLGIFQMETPGYRRTLRDFQPKNFGHIVALNALYRPGALDFKTDDGRTMVEVFIDRLHGRERVTYLHPVLEPILKSTYGIILYQEQAMQIAVAMAGFTGLQADELRRAIGKKKLKEMQALREHFVNGADKRGHDEVVINRVWDNIAAAARYSWNLSHSVFYGMITWWTAFFKSHHGSGLLTTPGFFAGLLNSYDKEKAERMGEAIAEARQTVRIVPPNVNLAEEGFVANGNAVVFGLTGVKGMGPSNRNDILTERLIGGQYKSFQDFCQRLPSVPINMKVALIRCGAFDEVPVAHDPDLLPPGRDFLLATCERANGKTWTIAEHINHNCKLKKPRSIPLMWESVPPTSEQLAEGELDIVGFYLTHTPLDRVMKALVRMDKHTHWGGKIERVTKKRDRNGNEMAHFSVLTPALTKQRCTMFASVFERQADRLEKGAEVIIRGRKDGQSILVDAVFSPDKMSHFRRMKLIAPDGTENVEHVTNPTVQQVEEYERAGYTVKLI